MHAELYLSKPLLLFACAVAVGCGDRQQEPRTAAFADRFELLDRIVLEEPDSAPLTGIRDFTPTPDGRYVVVDRGRPEVRLFAHDGRLLRTVGRFGDGPGEFRSPTAARMDGLGRLYVADGDGDLITRFTPDFAYDSAFSLPGMLAYTVDLTGDGSLFTILWNEPTKPHDFLAALLTPDGELIKGFHPVDSLIWSVPYWPSFSAPVGSAGNAWLVTGNSLFYPLHLHDAAGSWVRDFGVPPPFWRPADFPEAGAFIGVDGFTRLETWLNAMTTVSTVGIYRDSAVVVVHAQPRPQATDLYASRDLSLDIYDINGIKIWEDIAVPGQVLRIENLVYILEQEPPAPWTVGVYRIRPSGPGGG